LIRKREGRLTTSESEVVKALLAKGWRNQDIQALVNVGRPATVNSARITEVKQKGSVKPASDDVVEYFIIKKQSYDPKNGAKSFRS